MFTIPGRSEVAPRGISKFTHLNDGVMDLVLVKNTERKEFIRLLKRLGNTKNQVRQNKKLNVIRVMGMKILGRVGTHIFLVIFSRKPEKSSRFHQ